VVQKVWPLVSPGRSPARFQRSMLAREQRSSCSISVPRQRWRLLPMINCRARPADIRQNSGSMSSRVQKRSSRRLFLPADISNTQANLPDSTMEQTVLESTPRTARTTSMETRAVRWLNAHGRGFGRRDAGGWTPRQLAGGTGSDWEMEGMGTIGRPGKGVESSRLFPEAPGGPSARRLYSVPLMIRRMGVVGGIKLVSWVLRGSFGGGFLLCF